MVLVGKHARPHFQTGYNKLITSIYHNREKSTNTSSKLNEFLTVTTTTTSSSFNVNILHKLKIHNITHGIDLNPTRGFNQQKLPLKYHCQDIGECSFTIMADSRLLQILKSKHPNLSPTIDNNNNNDNTNNSNSNNNNIDNNNNNNNNSNRVHK